MILHTGGQWTTTGRHHDINREGCQWTWTAACHIRWVGHRVVRKQGQACARIRQASLDHCVVYDVKRVVIRLTLCHDFLDVPQVVRQMAHWQEGYVMEH